ncbi:MAG: DUF4154 domain-containing protein [Xanthomonadaceae bacterium]|nr:DUF4154 domain-containing protein [Xanthomonadaceae bacterium]
MMISHRIHKFLTCLALVACLATPAGAGLSGSQAAKIQAAFLVQFSKYISWPAQSFSSPKAPIIIGILGRDPFGSAINKISRSFKANGRSIEIIRLRQTAEAGKCHILFVAPDQLGMMPAITAAIAGNPVLLVSSTDSFLSRGGMINFIIVGTKIRFDINRKNSRKCNLRISATLLKIAHQVQQ